MQTLLVEVFWANAQWISGGLTAVLLVYTYYAFKQVDFYVKFCYTIATTAAALTAFELFRSNFNSAAGLMAVIATQALLFVSGVHFAGGRDFLGTSTITLYLLLNICALKISAFQASAHPTVTIWFVPAMISIILLAIAILVLSIMTVKLLIDRRIKQA